MLDVIFRGSPRVGRVDPRTRGRTHPGLNTSQLNATFLKPQNTTLKEAGESYEALILYLTQNVTGRSNDNSTFGITKGK